MVPAKIHGLLLAAPLFLKGWWRRGVSLAKTRFT